MSGLRLVLCEILRRKSITCSVHSSTALRVVCPSSRPRLGQGKPLLTSSFVLIGSLTSFYQVTDPFVRNQICDVVDQNDVPSDLSVTATGASTLCTPSDFAKSIQ
uniref:Secreted protein n=1 Tax=Heterorhabditis bacteriophora TaxID=37862 RepID=A0A1I7WFB5_HETBA